MKLPAQQPPGARRSPRAAQPLAHQNVFSVKLCSSHLFNCRTVEIAQLSVTSGWCGGNALQSEAASSIGSGLSIVGKIVGHGPLTIFGHVEGEVRASTIVIAEGAQIEGKVSAEEMTIGGYV